MIQLCRQSVLGWTAVACLVLLPCRPAFPSGFDVEGVLRTGEPISGLVEGERIKLAVIVTGGQLINLEIPPPATWSTLEAAGEIEWLPAREVYVIRATSFTAEALRIPAPFKFKNETGKATEVSWAEVRSVRFRPRR